MKERVLNVRRFLKFAVVGASGTIVNSLVLYLGYQVGGLPLLLASVLAVETAILNNFIWNNRWTFSQRDFALHRLVRFNIVSLGGLLVNVLTLYALVTGFGIHYLVANLAAIAAAMTLNFVGNVMWTWDSSPQT